MISFENTEIAFRGKSLKDLKKARWLFRLVSRPSLVKFGKVATNIALRLHLPINGIIKKTIFHQFCGGVSIKDSLEASRKLAEGNVKTILDYSIEGKTSEEDFDATVAEIIATIREAKNNPNIPFAVFKVTGICLFETLKKANDGVDQLSIEDRVLYEKVLERIDRICAESYAAQVPIFIDAEESWIQDSIDTIALTMSRKYNTERAIVYNTLQLYRHDRLAFMKNEIELARKESWFLGLKLVRGAYMEKERNRAREKNYPSPIQPNKAACDADFNAALELAVKNVDVLSICAGTHNEESALRLSELMIKHKIDPSDPRIFFAQLLGMSDHISFNLAESHYQVAKYVPYGPIREVLPYLIRRAEENTSVAGQTGRELSLILKEIHRRKKG
ncbi:MAG: proline dehydrogenase [Bacteroidetes bacterium RIFCSPHIGHO2_02_FULL_44_7]|nr:MAG: proline dehydrogenase [Bacteroidetes bacterium RIFCSPHIGHO2_02_FULL_44_7]